MAQIADKNGLQAINQVFYRIYRPSSADLLTSGLLSRFSADSTVVTYSGQFSVTINRTDIGAYRIEVYAKDNFNATSNVASTSLLVSRRNSIPVLGLPTMRQFSPAGSDSTQFTFTIFAADSDGINDIASVTVKAHGAIDSLPKLLLDNGLLSNGDQFPGDGIFSTNIWVTPTVALPLVVFEFVALDRAGSHSNVVFRTLLNHPPRIMQLDVPDSVQRPAAGTVYIPFYATVADSDGLGDIDSVYFRNFSSSTPANFLMYDDGDLVAHGDAVAHDGTYSRIVSIDPSTTLGNKEFHFVVVDKAGATSAVIHNIRIY